MSGLRPAVFAMTLVIADALAEGLRREGLKVTVAHDGAAALVVATACAFAGSFVGKRVLKQVTLRAVQITVAAAMLLIGAGLVAAIV